MLKHTKEGKSKMTELIREVFKDEIEEERLQILKQTKNKTTDY